MDVPLPQPAIAGDEDPAAASWDLGTFLDFTIDVEDPLILSWDGPPGDAFTPPLPPYLPTHTAEVGLFLERKGDTGLACPNYMAGKVPCSCPEEDQKEVEAALEEETAASTGDRKRTRNGRAAAAVVRCQVPGCEADISELKGYHKRHRVCLRCANALSVVLDGDLKRYCQQCGKFHILSDFDEGKRSCRRKLERHNKRRRRRPVESRSVEDTEIEAQDDLLFGCRCDAEPSRETSDCACETFETVVSSKISDEDAPMGSEASGVPQMVERRTKSKSTLSSTLCDNKSTYSSVCPTGRISFKLYDWNPAEFPRRLRHQIFQWLSNMPVELEGYIRPGCTILTVFISMPQFMWEKLSGDVSDCVKNLINAPDSLLLERGVILIYLSNKIIQVLKDGTSLMNIKMDVQSPRLHYVYPAYFEAGKPMEFVACGSNLEQPKLRFLVSFGGKYLKHDCSRVIFPQKTRCSDENGKDCSYNPDHAMFRIKIAHTDLGVHGPAFIEVENASGISNFIPIIVGSREICSEIKLMSDVPRNTCFCPSIRMCKVLEQRQTALSPLLLDIAWLIKERHIDEKDDFLSLTNVNRLTSVLQFLLQNELFGILEVITQLLDSTIGVDCFTNAENWTSDISLKQFHECLKQARDILHQRNQHKVTSELSPRSLSLGVPTKSSSCKCDTFAMSYVDQDDEENKLSTRTLPLIENVNLPLVSKKSTKKQHCYPNLGTNYSWNSTSVANLTKRRLAVFVTISVLSCLAACAILLHPHQAGKFAGSIRRCMFGAPMH